MKKIICFFMIVLISGTNIAFAGNFKIGDKGQNVKNIQSKLSSCGYSVGPCGADGIFGKGTADAVIRFQRDHGLKPDGIVDVRTNRALFSIQTSHAPEPKRRTLRQGDSGEDVKEVQLALISKGYSIGAYGADSKLGKATKEAIKQFQRDNNLNVDGIVGPATWKALKKPGSAKSSSSSSSSQASKAKKPIKKKLSEICKSNVKPKTNIPSMINSLFFKVPHSLPQVGAPNSIGRQYNDNGDLVSERFYGPDGRAQKDIDYTDHGNPLKHPKVPHSHNWDWNKPPKERRGDWYFTPNNTSKILNFVKNNLDAVGSAIKTATANNQKTVTLCGTAVSIAALIALSPALALIL